MFGIICSKKGEVLPILSFMTDVTTEEYAGMEFSTGKINGKDVVISRSGIGKVYAAICAQTMILKYHPENIINFGVAGGLADGLNIGDIVVATKVCQHDYDTSPTGEPIGYIIGINTIYMDCNLSIAEKFLSAAKSLGLSAVSGVIATGDCFVAEKSKKDWLKSEFNAVACEMEGGAIGQVCLHNGVDFNIIRSVSDVGDDNASINYTEFFRQTAERGADVLKKMFND